MPSNKRIFSASFSSSAAGDSPVSATFSASRFETRARAISISRSSNSSRRWRASWFIALLQATLKLDHLVGDAARIHLVGAGLDGLLDGGNLGRVHHRRI